MSVVPAGRPRIGWWLLAAALGGTIAIGGIIYGVVSVGVPYPDATPAQAAAERTNLAVSSWTTILGGIMLVGGLLAAAIEGAARVMNRPR